MIAGAVPTPVYDGYFADPFAWSHDGEYFAIGTGAPEATSKAGDRVFPLLRSSDFVHWRYAGRVLNAPDPAFGHSFWAPEVAYANGTFYLYYSVGRDDKGHHLRVATSHRPEGPYEDANPLIERSEAAPPFAIDPHPFKDDDGRWYLFYARDFLDGERPGTGLVAAPLAGMTRLGEGERVILRAHADWQRFQSQRAMYGGTYDWHTLEGPFIQKHGGAYYCFYSGGRWDSDNYGVDYAISQHPLGPYSGSGGEARVLRSASNRRRGPGHNSVVRGPDGSSYIVYHAWDRDRRARQMMVERLEWTPAGPRCAA